MDNKMTEMFRVAQAALTAVKHTGKTVAAVNEDTVYEAYYQLTAHQEITLVGVKDTPQIARGVIRKLLASGSYVWHTIDRMAAGGRAVDVSLVNPLTGKVMTGSSSATAINVLYGINDIGIGTDGGGSVLAPALSLNLYSVMAKGLGLTGCYDKVSTDGISFTPGIGIIGASLEKVCNAVMGMAGLHDLTEDYYRGIRVAVCSKGCLTLPDGSDMNGRLVKLIEELRRLGISVTEEDYPDFSDRREAIREVNALFKKYDMLLSYEGPVDLMGLGDSVFGSMGPQAKALQDKSGKYMVKVANMLNATCITLPGDDVSSGVVITARSGMESGLNALQVALKIKNRYAAGMLFQEYFLKSFKRSQKSIVFSLGECD